MSWREWFGHDEQPWWRLARRHPIEVFDKDTGEIHELKPGQTDPGEIEGLLIDFRYTDAQGSATRRSILCWQCWQENDAIYVTGYCPFREDFRTFRVDRMRQVIESRSGRHLPNDGLANYFGGFAHDRPNDRSQLTAPAQPADQIAARDRLGWRTPGRQELQADAIRRAKAHDARRQVNAGLRVLVYIAMADEVVTDEEASIETSYVEARLTMLGFEHDAGVNDWLLNHAAALVVPPRSLTIAVNAVAKDRAYFMLVLDCALRMVDVEEGVSELARQALEKLQQAGIATGWLSSSGNA